MDLTSIAFLGFLMAAAITYQLVQPRLRPLVLLVSSYIFYFLNSGGLLLLLIGDTVLVYCAALLIPRLTSQRMKVATAAASGMTLVLMLILFKGYYLISGSWIRQVVVPLGVSYYTFKLLGYLIDVFMEVAEPETSLVNFAVYISFFPQIVAGPIQRSEDFLPQTHRPVGATSAGVLLGGQRILLGFFKKFVVADNLAVLVNFIYAHLRSTKQPALLAFYGYPLQMYADFSGLTDIALGVALFFGFSGPENFNAPFAAASPSDYWRRWHITLTTWLTDYVFTPLRMSMRKLANVGLVISLTINMVLIGLWHGFRWTFVIFGLVHALYLSVDALSGKARREFYKKHPFTKKIAGLAGPVLTFNLVSIAFVCFRAPSMKDVFLFFSQLGSPNRGGSGFSTLFGFYYGSWPKHLSGLWRLRNS